MIYALVVVLYVVHSETPCKTSKDFRTWIESTCPAEITAELRAITG